MFNDASRDVVSGGAGYDYLHLTASDSAPGSVIDIIISGESLGTVSLTQPGAERVEKIAFTGTNHFALDVDTETSVHFWGGDSDAVLFGGAGSDILIGGEGSEFFSAGLGADRFVFAFNENGMGHDTILDFQVGEDTLQILGGAGQYRNEMVETADGTTAFTYDLSNELIHTVFLPEAFGLGPMGHTDFI
jgi:Ca2+-binding RTX toxin-like protein